MRRAADPQVVQTYEQQDHLVQQQTTLRKKVTVHTCIRYSYHETYLKPDAVHSFVTTKHDPLVPSWPSNWPNCTINEVPALTQSSTFVMDGHGELLWIHPD